MTLTIRIDFFHFFFHSVLIKDKGVQLQTYLQWKYIHTFGLTYFSKHFFNRFLSLRS